MNLKTMPITPRSPVMLDQCTIKVESSVRVNPAVFSDPKFRIGSARISGVQLSHKNVADSEESGAREALVTGHRGCIDIFEDKALSVITRRLGIQSKDLKEVHDNHFIESIQFNAPKVLYGHNGRVITTPIELLLALMIVQTALTCILVEPRESRMLIPGLAEGSSYWQAIEIAMQIKDSNRKILGQMGNMRSPGIRNTPAVREMNTTYQRGTRFTIKAYDKVAQMKATSKKAVAPGDTKEGITRLEIQLKPEALSFEVNRDDACVPHAVRTGTENGEKLRNLEISSD